MQYQQGSTFSIEEENGEIISPPQTNPRKWEWPDIPNKKRCRSRSSANQAHDDLQQGVDSVKPYTSGTRYDVLVEQTLQLEAVGPALEEDAQPEFVPKEIHGDASGAAEAGGHVHQEQGGEEEGSPPA